jgi:hypothetical protein
MIRAIASQFKGTKNNNVNGFDLTEITPRIYAMSFPSTNSIEKLYRNSLKAISTHIKKEHNEKYHIFNLSEREYGEENAFEGKVTYVNWKDHHNPTVLVLAEACA